MFFIALIGVLLGMHIKHPLTLLIFLVSVLGACAQTDELKPVKTIPDGCRFLNPLGTDNLKEVLWDGGCRDQQLDGQGKLVIKGKTSPKYGGAYTICTYTGNTSAGTLNGYGELVYTETNFYKGEFLNGRYHGKGLFKYGSEVYEGFFANGKYHGKGVLTKDKLRYEGDFQDGEYHGNGKLEQDGMVYTGGFEKGSYSGPGEMVYASGKKEAGTYEMGFLKGKRTIYYANGDTFVGDYSGKPEEAVYTWKDGTKFIGRYNSAYEPYNGQIFEKGVHVANLQNGKRVSPMPLNGTRIGDAVFVGDLVNGKPDGRGVYYFSNGDTLYGTFTDGFAEGNITYHYKNGLVFVGSPSMNRPSTGKVYQGKKVLYEMTSGVPPQQFMKDEPEKASAYPEGQYNPWNTYTKPKPAGSAATEVKTEDPMAGYKRGVATYKGVSEKSLVIEIQAEVMYRTTKEPGLMGLNYDEVVEARCVRFRYPGNSSTWYGCGSSYSLYSCFDYYICIDIKGEVFKLVLLSVD